MDRILDRINALQHDIRLLQTHTAEILRRLPPKATISPTQTMFSEEQPIE
jgi:hypothetical protein